MSGMAESAAAAVTPGTRLAWVCSTCQRECIPIRSESRCLCVRMSLVWCGHRHKDHDPVHGLRCTCGGCACRQFYYIVAQGAWILRCRCKHKHTDHCADTRACAKPGCGCSGFDSPFVCNCDHAWGDHKQHEVTEPPGGWSLAVAAAEVNAWGDVQRDAGA